MGSIGNTWIEETLIIQNDPVGGILHSTSDSWRTGVQNTDQVGITQKDTDNTRGHEPRVVEGISSNPHMSSVTLASPSLSPSPSCSLSPCISFFTWPKGPIPLGIFCCIPRHNAYSVILWYQPLRRVEGGGVMEPSSYVLLKLSWSKSKLECNSPRPIHVIPMVTTKKRAIEYTQKEMR